MPSSTRAYLNKFTNKLSGVVHMPAEGSPRGTILLSYMTAPFTWTPTEYAKDPHTNYWECAEIVRLCTLRGYAVDCINASNTTFIPRKKYAAIIDVNSNLDRLHTLLPKDCTRILHITFAYGAAQNAAEEARLDALFTRRGVRLSAARHELSNQSPVYADILEGFGNEWVKDTYAEFRKPILSIPISVSQECSFPEHKDFAIARTSFLWFGGGGAILKGLDLVVEAFAALPDYTLHLVGPASYEKEFEATYAKELSLPNIIRHPRPKRDALGTLFIDDTPFTEVMDQCASIIYPTASDSASGSVIQAMHAGIIPFVTIQSGIHETAPVTFIEPTIEYITEVAHDVAFREPDVLKSEARAAWEYVRMHHTKETFSAAYSSFLDSLFL